MPTARQACRSSQPRLLHGGLEDNVTGRARLVEDRLRECSSVVKIRHQGFATAPKAALDHAQGWTRVLAWMQAFVEKGETVDTRSPMFHVEHFVGTLVCVQYADVRISA